MPRNPRGMSGLGAVIRYAIELRTYNEIGSDTPPTLLTGIAGALSEAYRAKAMEIRDLKEILKVGKYEKKEILANIMREVAFKTTMRPENAKETVEE
jgi:hypothetical protein